MGKEKISVDKREYIRQLRRRGNDVADIALTTGVSISQIYKICREPSATGRWYTVTRNGHRTYCDNYDDCLVRIKNANEKIGFQPE